MALLKISHINRSDSLGGASRAAYRIHSCLLQDGHCSTLYVNHKQSTDTSVQTHSTPFGRTFSTLRPHFSRILLKSIGASSGHNSLALLPSKWPKYLNTTHPDIVHIHWPHSEMLSISDISRIRIPKLWTLHDMWAFCGSEHLSFDNRWVSGYSDPYTSTMLDYQRWTWIRKQKSWTKPFQLVTPSRWLHDCVRRSALMHSWPVTVIPNPLNTNFWIPLNQSHCRDICSLPKSVPMILFSAFDGLSNPNKGFDLLHQALLYIHSRKLIPNLHLLILGSSHSSCSLNLPFPAISTHILRDDISLRAYYNAADLVVVPSRIESFGQVASEAHSCGTPVVAFRTSGLQDIIDHQVSGHLAEPFDPVSLALSITSLLNDRNSLLHYGHSARAKAVSQWSYSVISNKYTSLYKTLLNI